MKVGLLRICQRKLVIMKLRIVLADTLDQSVIRQLEIRMSSETQ